MTTGLDILEWAHKNANTIGLQILLQKELSAIWKNAISARAIISFRGKLVQGIGHGGSGEEAIIVAIAELIERCCLYAYPHGARSSNGFAVHSDASLCYRAAMNELLERDAYLCHHLTQIPFVEVITRDLEFSNLPTIKELIDLGLTIRVGRMNSLGTGYGCVVIIDGANHSKHFGLIFSSAYDQDYYRAIERASREAMSSFAFRACTDEWCKISRKQFASILKPQPLDHGSYALFPDKTEWLEKMFVSSTVFHPGQGGKTRIQVETIEIPPELNNPPLFACRAMSTDLQDLFFGLPSLGDINLKRLNSFAGRAVTFNKLDLTMPHLLD